MIDRGDGIPEAKLETIFEKFKPADSSDSRAKAGTGLGLAICQSIVDNHGARIDGHSVEGAGSTFSFDLKKVAAPAEQRDDAAAPVAAAAM